MCRLFDDRYKVRDVSLNISEVYDKLLQKDFERFVKKETLT